METIPKSEDLAGEESSGIDLKELVLFGLGRSWLTIVFLALAGLAAGVSVAASIPNTFTSKAALRLAPGRRETLTVEWLVGGEQDPSARPGVVDELILLRDPVIYEAVAEELTPQRVYAVPDPRVRDEQDTSLAIRAFHELQAYLFARRARSVEANLAKGRRAAVKAAASKLLGSTTFEVPRGAMVISVGHSAADPESAQQFLGALLRAFVKRHQEVYTARPYMEKINEVVAQAEKKLEDSRDAFLEHQRNECGFFDLKNQKTDALRTVEELLRERDEIFARVVQLEAEVEEIDTRIEGVDKEIESTTTAPSRGSSDRDRLLAKRLDLVIERELKANEKLPFEQKAAEIVRLAADIAKIDDLIDKAEAERLEESKESMRNPEYERLNALIIEKTAKIQGELKYAEDLEKRLERAVAHRDDVIDCERDHDDWETQVAGREADLERLREQASDITGLNNLSAEGDSNLSVFQAALLPLEKDGPKRARIVLMGVGAGLAAGLALAVLRQLLDRRVRYAGSIERRLGVVVLAVLPEKRRFRRGLSRLSR